MDQNKVCSHCGTPNSPTSQFCLACGRSLAASVPVGPGQAGAGPSAPGVSSQPPGYNYPPPSYPTVAAPAPYPQQSPTPQASGTPDYGNQQLPYGFNNQYNYPQPGMQQTPGSMPVHSGAFGALRIDKLGDRLDGWADLVEGAGDKADAVTQAFSNEINQRAWPQVQINFEDVTTGGLAGKHRMYHINRSYTGASIAVYIGQFGEDLYLAWDLFFRPKVNWRNLAIMLGVSLILAVISRAVVGGIF